MPRVGELDERARQRALVVPDKAERVYNFHRATIESLAELVAAAGLDHPHQLALAHFSRRVSPHEVKSFVDLYPSLAPGELKFDFARGCSFIGDQIIGLPALNSEPYFAFNNPDVR